METDKIVIVPTKATQYLYDLTCALIIEINIVLEWFSNS